MLAVAKTLCPLGALGPIVSHPPRTLVYLSHGAISEMTHCYFLNVLSMQSRHSKPPDHVLEPVVVLHKGTARLFNHE